MLRDPAFKRRLTAVNLRLPVARACGLRKGQSTKLLDATAGLGRDGLLLAALGADVTMVERNAPRHVALQDDLANAAQDPDLAPILSRVKLVHADAKDWLQKLVPAEWPDVVFVDPMHPMRSKSAKVKAHMATLQSEIGPDEDAGELLAVALAMATRRVALKWPAKADLPDGLPKPTFTIPGKTVRYVGWEIAA